MDCVKRGCYDTVRGIFMNPVANNIESCLSRQTARQVSHHPASANTQERSLKKILCVTNMLFAYKRFFFFFPLETYFPEGQCYDLFKGMIPPPFPGLEHPH